MLSYIGLSLSIYLPMLHAHPATFPLINMRVMVSLHIEESNPVTLVLALKYPKKYPKTSSIKSSASDWFPLKI